MPAPQVTDPDISDFLLHTCHDLRSGIRAIHVHTEMLVKERETGESENFAQHVGAILADSRKLEMLANGISGYAAACQIDPQSFVVAPLEVILRTELALLGKELRENHAEVTYDALPKVLGDPDRLQQLFDQLLRNALLHCGSEAPRIHISAKKQGETWVFGVQDNGPGIESAYLERIFTPFGRLCGKQLPGPGLGLTTCRKVVQRHGGMMWAESEPGAGTTIFFTLPCEPAA